MVTTFASQGTGEIPRKLPHRILVAAYWIFVLVMMTTFTANLAAFLTVERLQVNYKNVLSNSSQSRENMYKEISKEDGRISSE